MPIKVSLEYLVPWRVTSVMLIAFTLFVTVSVFFLVRYLGTLSEVPTDSPTAQTQTEYANNVSVRTVATQSMCTYRRKLATPRFEWISPRHEDGVWVHHD